MPDRSHVGRTYRADGQVIDGERAARFAEAIAGDDGLIEPGVVPPTYAAVYCLSPTLAQLFGDAELGIGLAGLVHAEQEFSFHQPVRAGDVIDASVRIASVAERRGRVFLGVELEATRAGRPVCSGRALFVAAGGAP